MAAIELQARSARAEATREHARLLELETQIVELNRRLASQTRACAATPDPLLVDVARALPPKVEPFRSEGDFLAEARVVAPTARPPARALALGVTTQAADPAAERERLQQQLEVLREYTWARQGGLSLERREALRVLLRHDRQLDLMDPWSDRLRHDRQLDLMDPWSDR